MSDEYRPHYSVGEWVYYSGSLFKIESLSESDDGPVYVLRTTNSNVLSVFLCEEIDSVLQKA